MTAVSRTIAERYTLLEKLGDDGAARAALVERLRREAMAGVDHPSVVPVHEVVVADEWPSS